MHSNLNDNASCAAMLAECHLSAATFPALARRAGWNLTDEQRDEVFLLLDKAARSVEFLLEVTLRTKECLTEAHAVVTRYAVDTPPSASARFTGRTDVQ